MTARRNRVHRWYNVMCGEKLVQTTRASAARRTARRVRSHTQAPIVVVVREATTTHERPPEGHYSFAHRPYRSGLVKAWEVLPDGRFRRLPVRRSTRGGHPDNLTKEELGSAVIEAAGGLM